MAVAIGDGGAKASTNAVEKFLTPEAMLTPGAAGGVTMLIANALANNFSLPIAYLGLGLSFLFGLLVLASARKWYERAIYYVLNSLIIFCVAFGSGNIVASTAPAKPQVGSRSSSFIVTEAYADTAQNAKFQQLVELQSSYEQLDAQYSSEVSKLAALGAQGASSENIAKQNAVVQELFSQKNANLKEQAALLKSASPPPANNPDKPGGGTNSITGGPNSVVNNPNQLKGGPNSVINNPKQLVPQSPVPPFFNQWKF